MTRTARHSPTHARTGGNRGGRCRMRVETPGIAVSRCTARLRLTRKTGTGGGDGSADPFPDEETDAP
jgi:hypothetical protein